MDRKKNVKAVAAVAAVLFCGIIYLCGDFSHGSGETAVETEGFSDSGAVSTGLPEKQESEKRETADGKVYIHVCGEVKKPGVYIFDGEPRVVEAVKKAGGFTRKADRSAINQAELVSDGTQLVIEAKGKAGRAAAGTGEKKSGGGQSDGAGTKVNINTASKEELMTLSGIGEAKASQILSYRENNGKFKRIEDIMNISGIKEGVFSKIKEYITV